MTNTNLPKGHTANDGHIHVQWTENDALTGPKIKVRSDDLAQTGVKVCISHLDGPGLPPAKKVPCREK